MRQNKRFLTLILSVILLLTNGLPVFAEDSPATEPATQVEMNFPESTESDIMNLEGPTITIDLGDYGSGVLTKNADGSYRGEMTTRANGGVTAVVVR